MCIRDSSSTPLSMHDGSVSYSDGYQLLSLFYRKKAPKSLKLIEEKFHKKKYEETISLGEKMLKEDAKLRYVYDYMIASLVELDSLSEALEVFADLKENIQLSEKDYFEIGLIYQKLGKHKEALKYFEYYRYKNFNNSSLLTHMGSSQIEIGESRLAIQTLSVALNVDQSNLSLIHI